jgi:hypothetical protein
MRTKFFFPVLVWTFLAVGTTSAQMPETLPNPSNLPDSSPLPGAPGSVSMPLSPPNGMAQAPVPHKPPVPDDWILYRKCEACCGPLGGEGPLRTELYIQSGWSFPVGGGTFGETLTTGWVIQGGARLMLFDVDMDGACYVDLSGSNIWNQGRNPNITIPFTTFGPNGLGGTQEFKFGQGNLPGVSIRNLNRTFVNLAVGRDWYLLGSAAGCGGNCDGGCSWRVGFDAGGRYGADSVEFHEIRQASGVCEGAFAGFHSDVEIPCGCCVFFGGVRVEWSYTWSHILQRQSDMQEIDLLFTAGVRY